MAQILYIQSNVSTDSNLLGVLLRYSRYSHREHTDYYNLLPYPRSKTPHNRRWERNSRDVQQEVEYSKEQIKRL